MRPLTHCICRKIGVNVNIWFPSRASDWSPLRWAEISRERPLAEALRRCDALAVAVGLIDRKHVGVVGANRDAAAAKGVPASRPHMSTFKYTRLFVSAAAAAADDDDDALSVFSFKDPFETKGEPVDAVANRAVPLGASVLCLI